MQAMRDELQDYNLPKFDDNDEMFFSLAEREAVDFSKYLRPRFDDNDEMFFDDESIYLGAIS